MMFLLQELFKFNLGGNHDDTSVAMTRYAVTATLAATNDLDPLVDAINKHAANTGVTAKLGATAAEIILTHQTGENIDLTSIMVGGVSSGTFKLDALDKFGNSTATADTTLNRATRLVVLHLHLLYLMLQLIEEHM